MKFMDMLYHRYACPMDLMNNYINRGRFGEFVSSFLEAEYERRKEEMEKDEDMKLWLLYIGSGGFTEKSFGSWKKENLQGNGTNDKAKSNKDNDISEEGIMAIIDDLFPA